jgi:hypothetical protein
MSHSGKRARLLKEQLMESKEDEYVIFDRKASLLFGLNFCKIGNLTRDDLLMMLLNNGTIRRMHEDEFVHVNVTHINGDEKSQILLPHGQGLSSVYELRKKAASVFGVMQKCIVLVDKDGTVMDDSEVLRRKAGDDGHFNVQMAVVGSDGGYQWTNDGTSGVPIKETAASVTYEVSPCGGKLKATTVLGCDDSRDVAYVVPVLSPAVAYQSDCFAGDMHIGAYSISFKLGLSDTNTSNTGTAASATAPSPSLRPGCYIGIQSYQGPHFLLGDMYASIDLFTGKGTTLPRPRRCGPMTDGIPFLSVGNVLTMLVDFRLMRVMFFVDGRAVHTAFLDIGDLAAMQAVAYIPVLGYEVSIVGDPILQLHCMHPPPPPPHLDC